MNTSDEQLTIRFVELLAEKARSNGQPVSNWAAMPSNWRRVFSETVPAFLRQIGYRLGDGKIDDQNEDEQLRQLCENLTERQRLKTYRQLYALGCRIDSVDRGIEKLSRRT
jgi:hypothetical protein